jgi:DNA polymerase-3 subunit delta
MSGGAEMITLLTGDNTFAIRDVLDARTRQTRDTLGADAITTVDANDLDLNDLPQLLLGASLFASERLIVIRDAAANKLIWEKFTDLLPDVADTTSVILLAPNADKRTKTYKWLQKNAEVREARDLNEAELVQWLKTEAHHSGIDIKPEVARYLIEFVGTDQWRLRQDLEKLRLSGNSPSVELIRELIEPNPQASVFQLLDAVMARNSKQVEQYLKIIQGSEDPYRFFGLLSNQIYALLVCAAAGNRDAATIARDAGVHPFVIRKLLPIARKLNALQRQTIVDIMADLDRQLKSTGADPWTLIRVALSAIAV